MYIKLLIGILLLFIVFNLFRALFVMVKGTSTPPVSHYLGRRVLFSVIVMAIIVISQVLGWLPLHATP